MIVYTLNAFAKTIDGGNPAGVVLNSENLTDHDKQVVAKKIGFSETVFVEKSDKADFKLRFFTTNGEVDLCGHATIGAFVLMLNLGLINPGKYFQETKAGVLSIEVKENNMVFMNHRIPEFFEIMDKQKIADSLNIGTDMMIDDLPIQIVSTGLRDIFIPVKTLRDLLQIKPNFKEISRISKDFQVTGYHIFTLETQFKSTAHCRNLAPLYNIPEEAATGTSNGALSCYLRKYGKLSNGKIKNIVIEQGYSMKRPSEIVATLRVLGDDIIEVRVGGSALNIQEKKIV